MCVPVFCVMNKLFRGIYNYFSNCLMHFFTWSKRLNINYNILYKYKYNCILSHPLTNGYMKRFYREFDCDVKTIWYIIVEIRTTQRKQTCQWQLCEYRICDWKLYGHWRTIIWNRLRCKRKDFTGCRWFVETWLDNTVGFCGKYRFGLKIHKRRWWPMVEVF